MLPFFTKIQKDYQAFNKHSLWVILSIAIYSFGSGFFDPYFSVFLNSFTTNYSQLGLLVSVFTFVSALLTIPVGYLMDFVQYRTMLTIGKVLSVIVAILYFIAGQYQLLPILIFALVLNGIAFPFNWTGTETVLGAYSKKHKTTELFGFYGSLVNIAWMVGLLIAAFFVVERYPLHFIFLPLMFFPIFSILIFNTKLPDNRHAESFSQGVSQWIRERRITSRFLSDLKVFNGEMWLMMGIAFLEKFIQVAITVFIPVVVLKENASLLQIGLLMALMHVSTLFSFIFAELSNRGVRLLVIVAGFALTFISCLTLVFASQQYAIFLSALFAITGLVVAAPSILGIITKLTPKGHFGTVTALHTLVRRIGLFVAPIALGSLADHFSMQAVYWFVALCAGIVVCVTLFYRFAWIKKDRLYEIEHPNGHKVPYYL
ncbi:MAG: MFS transporter [Patescibacteria group bacterium]